MAKRLRKDLLSLVVEVEVSDERKVSHGADGGDGDAKAFAYPRMARMWIKGWNDEDCAMALVDLFFHFKFF